jgi:hypothetical protein
MGAGSSVAKPEKCVKAVESGDFVTFEYDGCIEAINVSGISCLPGLYKILEETFNVHNPLMAIQVNRDDPWTVPANYEACLAAYRRHVV